MKKLDSLLIYAYGGPESMEDVEPFLQNIAQGKRISQERLAEVLSHYALFDGRSPMNGAIREFMRLWSEEVPEFPVFFGCRYAKPDLKETLRQMAMEGKRRPLVFIPSPFGGYLTTYFEKWTQVQKELANELGEDAFPEAEFFPPFSENTHFLNAVSAGISEVLAKISEERRNDAVLLFSIHSLPTALARRNGYEAEVLAAVKRLEARFPQNRVLLGWQSASAAPIPWLEPSTLDVIQDPIIQDPIIQDHRVPGTAQPPLLLIPLGFPFENMEVAYDLDVEARELAESLGFPVFRVPTVGLRPEIRVMLQEYITAE